MGEHADGAPILISGDQSASLARVSKHTHDERWLQTLIHRHPACLPIGEIEPAFDDLTPVCMELPVSSGSVDNLLMTADGNIVIVEVKLWRNPESRRTVIAQALDYATAMFRMDYEDLESSVIGADFDDGERPSSLYDLFRDDPDVLPEGAFVDAVNRNLNLGSYCCSRCRRWDPVSNRGVGCRTSGARQLPLYVCPLRDAHLQARKRKHTC